MKLTIKTENGQKVVDLNSDLQFNAIKGEQYVFSNGFSNYVLNFKDNQESVTLTFNVDGKSIKVELNGIVPHLQANTQDTANPTAIIINKGINNKDVDNLLTNADFNGGEIIDRLEAIISKPVELGDAKNSNVTLITDYQTLLESLGAAAAGGEAAAGNANGNGSTFNSIFSLTDGGLNDIAATDRWVNLSESISTIPVETADTIAPQTIVNPINPDAPIDEDVKANIEVTNAGSVKEADGATLTYSVKLSNAVGSDVEVDLTTGGTATKGSDYEDTLKYSTDNGTTWLAVPATGKVTLPANGTSVLVKVTVKDDAITEPDETVTLTATTTDAQITTQTATGTGTINDDKGPDSPIDEDVKATIVIGDAGSVTEANNTYLTYDVKLSNAVGSNVEITLNTTGSATAGDDYKSQLQYSIDNGTSWLDVPTTNKITLPANGSVVKVRAEVLDDAITESNETVILNATTTNAQITSSSDTGTGTINDDKGPDSPIDEDVKATIVIGDAGSVTEANNTYLTYDVKLSNAVGSNVEITLNTTGSATAGSDYKSQLQYSIDNGTSWLDVPTTNKITLPANGSVVKVRAEVLDDAITESNETVILNATTTNAQITSSSDTGTGTINDDKGPDSPIDEDIKATIVIGDAGSVTEANNTYLTYDVKLSNAVGSNVEITLNTTGSATAGSDYKSQLQYSIDNGTSWLDVPTTNKITLPANGSVVKVRAEVLDDAITESNETVILNATTTNAQITSSSDTGTGTINDDKGPDSPIDEDIKATIVIGDAGSVTEANNTYLTYDVKLSNAVGSNVEITLNTTGSATAGSDYKSQLQYSIDNGTSWLDVPTTNKITLPANGSVVKVRAEVLDDAITESNETVILNATTTNAQITSSSDTGTGTINDDKGPDSPIDEDIKATIVIGDAGSVTEANNTYLTYDVKLSNAVGSNVEITLNTTGSATAGSDYKSQLQYSIDNGTSWLDVPTTNKITLPANGSVVKVRAEVLDDAITESNETVILNATTTNAQITSSSDTGTGTINDDKGPDSPIDEDIKATIVIGDAGSVTEANNTYLTYDVKLSNAVGSNVEITLNTTGSATAGSDYKSQLQYSIDNGTSWLDVPTTNKITLPANGSVVKVRAEVLDDAITESNETVILNATTTNAQITSSSDTGTGTINDDKGPDSPIDEDIKATIVIGDAGSVTEANNTYLTYDVKLSNAVGSNVEITLNTTGSATAGDDYKSQLQYSIDNGTSWLDVPTTNKITLPANGSVVKVRAEVLDDAITESNETVILNATTTNAQITSSSDTGTGTINDDKGPDSPIDEDIKATIVIGDAGSVTEANNTYLTYDVKLSNAVGSNVEITLNTTGSATAGSDYKSQLQYSIDNGTSWLDVPTTNKITLPANGSVVKVRAEVLDDAITESNETVILNATTTNAQITSSSDTGTGTIVDNDFVPVVQNVNINISEEGLVNGIKDLTGIEDKTDNSTITGTMSITDANNDAITVTLVAPTNELKSNGQTVVWTTSTNGQELVGKVGTTEVIKVTINNAGEYKVQLLAPVTHPINSVEDVISLNIGVKASDGSSITTGNLVVNIEDDMPTIGNSTTVWTQATSIPDILTGNVSFTGSGGVNTQYTFANGAVAVTGKGFTSSTDLTLVAANLTQTSNGIGIKSVAAPYFNLENEVDYRKTANGVGASEELKISLADGKISYGAKINFNCMFGGEKEVGVVEFYRGNVLVSTQTFSSDAAAGNYAANFQVLDGGFDSMIIKATDNGNAYSAGDNSDFSVSGVEFLGTTAINPISYAQGTIPYLYGADGAGSISLTGLSQNVTLSNGSSVTLTTSNNSIVGKDASGNLVFQIQLTPATGKWEFYQYQNIKIADGTSEKIDFNFKVVDADGDGLLGSSSIGVNKLPVSTNDIIDAIEEDKSYILTKDDFGTYSSDITKVRIDALPTNGTLLLAGIAVLVGKEISLADIIANKLVFTPTTNSDVDSSFTFKVSNGTLWSTSSYKTDINITAVADTPTVSINVSKIDSSGSNFDFDTGRYSYTAKSSEFSSDITKLFSVNVSDADGDKTSLDVNLKVDIGDKQVVNTYSISGDDIDLTSIIHSNTKIDVINLDNATNDKINIDFNDLLVQEDKQLILKGNDGDLVNLVDLDSQSDWSNAGQEQLDGVNYNVYTGTGLNSTIKLLIEDDIDVKPDI